MKEGGRGRTTLLSPSSLFPIAALHISLWTWYNSRGGGGGAAAAVWVLFARRRRLYRITLSRRQRHAEGDSKWLQNNKNKLGKRTRQILSKPQLEVPMNKKNTALYMVAHLVAEHCLLTSNQKFRRSIKFLS